MKAIDKVGQQLGELLDERVIEYLSAVQMNQLLATCAELGRGLDEFNRKVRLALKSKEYGFQETYIHCPLCGRVELVGSLRCSVCWTILRRCYDCGNYDRVHEKCGVNSGPDLRRRGRDPQRILQKLQMPRLQAQIRGAGREGAEDGRVGRIQRRAGRIAPGPFVLHLPRYGPLDRVTPDCFLMLETINLATEPF